MNNLLRSDVPNFTRVERWDGRFAFAPRVLARAQPVYFVPQPALELGTPATSSRAPQRARALVNPEPGFLLPQPAFKLGAPKPSSWAPLSAEALESTESVTDAPADVFVEHPSSWIVRCTEAFAAYWLLVLSWSLLAACMLQIGCGALALGGLVSSDALVAFAEWVAQTVWWFGITPR